MLADILLRPFELVLNRGLAQSTTAQALAAGLEGRTLGLTLDGTPLDLRLRASGGRLHVGHAGGNPPDAVIRGTPLALGGLLRRDPQAAVREGNVHIEGDADIAGQFETLLRFTIPDLEEELSRLVGDPVAHQLGNATRAFGKWGEAARRTVERSVSEYLQEEAAILPTAAEIEGFGRAVAELVNGVERAEARLRHLKERM